MIQEQYVSFETAKLLKEKGFSESTIPFYESNGKFCSRIGNVCQPADWSHEYKFGYISAPTQQMALRWLREHHLIGIVIVFFAHEDGIGHAYEIKRIENPCTPMRSRVCGVYKRQDSIHTRMLVRLLSSTV